MRAAIVVALLAFAGYSEGIEEKQRVNKMAVAQCESLGGIPVVKTYGGGDINYEGCNFALRDERERREREGKIEPRIGAGTAGRLEQ